MAKGFLCGVITGGIIAGAAALLLAPKTGEEIRKNMKCCMDEFTDPETDKMQYATDKLNKAVENAQELVEKLKDKKADLERHVGGDVDFEDIVIDAKDDLADAANDLKDEAKDTFADVKDVVTDKAEEVKDAVTDKAEELKSE